MTALGPFATVEMLGRWPVTLPAYRVEHCAAQPNWEEGRLLSMHAHLKPGMVLYDVGAEHGDLSALYGTWLRGDPFWDAAGGESAPIEAGGVVLVEGSDKFWPVVRATFEANGLEPVACFAGFASDIDAWDGEAWQDVGRSAAWPTDAWVPEGWPSWAEGDPVPHHGFKSVVESGRTLPNIRFDTIALMTSPPDALTIDVEGAELLVLRGSERILREHRPLVWVSVHPTLIAHDYPESGVLGTGDPDHERQRVLDYMTGFGYQHAHLEDNHEEHFVFYPEERTDFDPWLGVEHLRP